MASNDKNAPFTTKNAIEYLYIKRFTWVTAFFLRNDNAWNIIIKPIAPLSSAVSILSVEGAHGNLLFAYTHGATGNPTGRNAYISYLCNKIASLLLTYID